MIKKLTIISGIILTTLSLYLGAYLPWVKARKYIKAAGSFQTSQLKTVENFEEEFDKVFNFYSPIGQSESLRFLGNLLLTFLRQDPKPSEVIGVRAVTYLEEKFKADIEQRPGLSHNQNHTILGSLFSTLWLDHQNVESLKKAIEYYEIGLSRSPKRPEFLRGLFILYYSGNQIEQAKNIGQQILQLWPDDEVIKQLMGKLTEENS